MDSDAKCVIQRGKRGGKVSSKGFQILYGQHGQVRLVKALKKIQAYLAYISSNEEEIPKSCKSEPAMVIACSFSSNPLPQARQRPGSIHSQHGICETFPDISADLVQLMLKNYIRLIKNWKGFDIFCFTDLTKGRPLTVMVVAVLTHFKLFEKFNLSPAEVESCVEQLEAVYKDNPYHNSIHAADVTQSMCAVLAALPVGALAPDELLALVVGAAMHDAEHPGKSNNYHEATKDPMYQQHPTSTNEYHHVDTWELLLQQKNFTRRLPAATEQRLLAIIRRAVHFTDMVKHFELLNKFKAYVDELGPDISTWTDPEARDCLLSFILHACDISNGLRAILLAANWAERVTLENFAEGAALFKIDPTLVKKPFDSTKVDLPGSQVFFLTNYLMPTFEELARVAPEVGNQALATGCTNLAKWTELQQDCITTLEASAEALRKPEPTPTA